MPFLSTEKYKKENIPVHNNHPWGMQKCLFGKRVLIKQWPLAPNSHDSLITRANVSRQVTFFQKWPLANVGESGEAEQNRLANVGESGESEQTRLANVGKFGESGTFPKKAILASTRI